MRLTIGACLNMGSVSTLATSVANISAPTWRQDSFSPSPGTAPPRDGLWPPKPSAKSGMSAAAGAPGASEHFASGPFVLVKPFTPWYKCRPRPDRCRQFLRRRPPVLGALVLGRSIKDENLLSFLCVLGFLGLFDGRWMCSRGDIKELEWTHGFHRMISSSTALRATRRKATFQF